FSYQSCKLTAASGVSIWADPAILPKLNPKHPPQASSDRPTIVASCNKNFHLSAYLVEIGERLTH
ncbi:MAG TPA: hypothetical protein DCZ55_02840, partial [Cyanobacteria bacterium UBA11371]|nr:hypothetical protein [Cyanobacteria bacterium UBA11371]